MAKSKEDRDYEESIQGLVVISCADNTSTKSVIKKLLNRFNHKSDDCEEYEPKELNFGTDRDIDCYDLMIDNKYYSANIYLFDIKEKQLISRGFADCVEGVLIYFDSNRDSSLADVQSWQPFINPYNNEIKLLVCETIDDTIPAKRELIMKWSLDNEFELVELCPNTDDQHLEEDLSEDDFREVDGMVRIKQSIQAYHWPYSALKERPQYNPSDKFKDLIDKEVFNSINDNSVKELDKSVDSVANESKEFNENDNEFENFDDLFTKFGEMKVKASQMSETDRKSYAERVTLAFWRAIDGDPHEIEGLDSNDMT